MKFTGTFPAMVTPHAFDDFSVMKEKIEAVCDFIISKGGHGLFPLGTTGEGLYLEKDKRKKIAEIILQHVNNRVPVIVHTGMFRLDDTIELSIHGKDINADAVSIITPCYYPKDDLALFDFFTSIAKAVDNFPVFIYNLPSFTTNNVSPNLLVRIAKKADNIIGIKDSSGNLVQLREYRRKMGKDFNILNGSDKILLASLFEKCDGIVSGNASYCPEIPAAIYNSFKKGDYEEAARQQELLDKLRADISGGVVISYFKTMLRFRGIDTGKVIPPLRETTKDEERKLKNTLKDLKLL